MTTFYKIRNKRTGLFSKGGNTPLWNKTGKTWQTLGLLRSHITLALEYPHNKLNEWEVIPLEVVEQAPLPLDQILSEKQLVRLLTK